MLQVAQNVQFNENHEREYKVMELGPNFALDIFKMCHMCLGFFAF